MRDSHIFEYSPGAGPLCRLGAGLKLAFLVILSISTAALPAKGLFFPAAVILSAMISAGAVPAKQFLAMWKLLLFFAAAGIIRGYTAGSAAAGIIFSTRLILLSAAGLVFYCTTRITELRKGLKRLFSAVPFIDGIRTAELTVMALYFLPLIFKTISGLQEARYSRCFNIRRGIIRSIRLISVPLMINMFLKTEEMADAWYSRGYKGENR